MNRAYKPLQNQWQRWMPARSRPMKGVLFYSIAIWINCLGTGMFSPFSLLYFHKVKGFPLPLVGIGLSLATASSIVMLGPAGGLIDRFGARRMLILSMLMRTGGFLLYLWSHDFVSFIAIALIIEIGNAISQTSNQAIIPEIIEPEHRDWLIGLVRTVFNAGIGLGTVFAGVIISLNSDNGYRLVVLLNAMSFFLAGLLLIWQRSVSVAQEAPAIPQQATTDSLMRQCTNFPSVWQLLLPQVFPSAPWLVLALATGIASVVIYLVRNLLLTPRMAQ